MIARLGDVVEQIRGVSYSPSDLHDNLDNDSVILLRANNIQNGKIVLDDVVYVSKSKTNESQYLRRGDILVCTSSGSKELVGKAAFVDENLPMVFGAFCKIVRPKIECYKYMGHFFQSPYYRNHISAVSAGANINNLRNEHIADLYIPLPSLDEQRKIAEVLDKVSNLIAKRRQQLDKLDLLVKARFVEMFGDLRSNEHGWDFLALSQLCDVRDGTHDSPQYMSKGYPLLTSKNFTSGTIDFTDCNLISKEDFDKINQRSNVDVGDIIMPMIGTIGNPVIVDTKRPFAIKNVALIKFVNNQVSNVFIRHLLTSDYFKQITFTFSRGGTQKFVALGDIRKLPIPLVPSQLQNQFAAFVKQTENTKTTISHSLEKLETLKKALMQEFFTKKGGLYD